MKKVFLYIVTLLPLIAAAQFRGPFTIKAKVGHLNPPARAYLIYQPGDSQVVDSVQIHNGSFTFTGKIIEPESAFMVIDPHGIGLAQLDSAADNIGFYIDRGVFTMIAKDSIAKAKITGSKINDDNKKISAQLAPIIKRADILKAEQNAATPAQQNSPEFQNAMQAKYKDVLAAQEEIFKAFILSHPDNYLSLFALNSVSGPSPDPAKLDPLYNLYKSLSPGLKSTETAKAFKHRLDGIKVTAIGAPAPDFIQADVKGVPVKLSSFKGKYVLIDFWASWCVPCRQENPNVVKAYNKYKDKNLVILGVSLDKPEGKAAWLAAIKNDGLNWTQVSDLKFWNNRAATLYFVSSIPTNFLIDPNGRIIAKNLRGDDLEKKLEEVLGK